MKTRMDSPSPQPSLNIGRNEGNSSRTDTMEGVHGRLYVVGGDIIIGRCHTHIENSRVKEEMVWKIDVLISCLRDEFQSQ